MSFIVNSILFHCILFCSIVFYKCGTPSSEEIKRCPFFPYRPRRAELCRRYIDDIVGGASCRRKELEAFVNFVANFNPALQFTSTIFEIKLPFLDISLRISDIRIQTSTTSIFLLSILNTANVLSHTASFSACVAFALAMMTSLCDQRRWFLSRNSLLTAVILFSILKMIYRE